LASSERPRSPKGVARILRCEDYGTGRLDDR
jgi:hypothetical protein